MPAVKSSLVHPAYKTEYRVRNWREYEQGLRARGDVTIWFSEEATASWIWPPPDPSTSPYERIGGDDSNADPEDGA